MSDYLVVKALNQTITLYRILANTPKDAIDNLAHYNPFKEYSFDNIYGDGTVAIPYSIANVILIYIKLFFQK